MTIDFVINYINGQAKSILGINFICFCIYIEKC